MMHKKYENMLYKDVIDKVFIDCEDNSYDVDTVLIGISTLNELLQNPIVNSHLKEKAQRNKDIISFKYSYYQCRNKKFHPASVAKFINDSTNLATNSSLDDKFKEKIFEYQKLATDTSEFIEKINQIDFKKQTYDYGFKRLCYEKMYDLIYKNKIDEVIKKEYIHILEGLETSIKQFEQEIFSNDLKIITSSVEKYPLYTLYNENVVTNFPSDRLLAISSPIHDEGLMLAEKWAKNNKKTYVHFDVSVLETINSQAFDYIFDILAASFDLIIFNDIELVEKYDNSLVNKFFTHICRIYNNSSVFQFFINKSSKFDINKILGKFDIKVYVKSQMISVPPYDEFIKCLASVIDTSEDKQQIMIHGYPLGYIGLNELMRNLSSSKERIYFLLEKMHKKNYVLFDKYAQALSCPFDLVEPNWRYNPNNKNTKFERQDNLGDFEIDYETISIVNDDEINNIINHHHLSIFAKCGLVVLYILNQFKDDKEYDCLPIKEKKDRVKSAITILSQMMRIDVQTIEFLHHHDNYCGSWSENDHKLMLTDKTINQMSEIADTILHELYHALQYNYSQHPQFYYDVFKIHPERALAWSENNETYISVDQGDIYSKIGENVSKEEITNMYRSQAMEVDARTFASESIDQANHFKGVLDFKSK